MASESTRKKGKNGGKAAAPPQPKGPVYFTRLEVENIRCFSERQTLDLTTASRQPSMWTVLLGDNGTGKTTLLQVLALIQPVRQLDLPGPLRKELIEVLRLPVAFFSRFESALPEQDRMSTRLTRGSIHAAGSIRLEGKPGGMIVALVKGEGSQEAKRELGVYGGGFTLRFPAQVFMLDVVHAYGAARLASGSSLSDFDPTDPTATLFSEDARLINAEEWLLQADYAAARGATAIREQLKAYRDRVKDALIDLLPDVDDIEFVAPTKVGETPSVRFKTPYGLVALQDLGLGYRTLLAWMVDFAVRLFDRYPESPNPLAEPAICLIDEIDLHMHPSWQRKIMSYLRERFPKTQFIVTAHSPLIVQAAEDANVAVLRREGDHVVIDNNPQSVRGWRVDQILTSDLFGLETARPPEQEKLLQERRKILAKARITKRDQERITEIDAELDTLPTGETKEDREAMDLIRRAAKRLKEKEAAEG